MSESNPDRENESDLTTNEANWKLAQLVTQLVAERFSKLQPDSGPMWKADKDLDTEIHSAIRRAKLILHLVEHPREESVHLYRAFKEGATYTETTLAKRILEMGWVEVSPNTVRNRLESIRDAWKKRLQKMEKSVKSDLLLAERVQREMFRQLKLLDQKFDISDNFSEYPKWCKEMGESLLQEWPLENTDLDSQRLRFEEEFCLSAWCVQEPQKKGKGSSERIYRPHELFRFTERFEWFPNDFGPRLLSELHEDFQPGVVRPDYILSFEEFHRNCWTTNLASEYLPVAESE